MTKRRSTTTAQDAHDALAAERAVTLALALTLVEVAEVFGVNLATVRAAARAGRLPGRRSGATRLVHRDDAAAWVATLEQRPREASGEAALQRALGAMTPGQRAAWLEDNEG